MPRTVIAILLRSEPPPPRRGSPAPCPRALSAEMSVREIHAAIVGPHIDRRLGDRPTKGFGDAPQAGPYTHCSGKTVFLRSGILAAARHARGDGATALIDRQVDARSQ